MTRSTIRLVSRRFALAAFTVVATALAACSTDRIAAPQLSKPDGLQVPTSLLKAKDSLKLLGQEALIAEGLLWEVPLAAPVSVSEMITKKKGGKIHIKELGLEIDVPKDAILDDSLLITVTALPGSVVAYEFQPHGTQFLAPLVFEQNLKNTNWEKKDIKTTLWGAYFADPGLLNSESSLAVVSELIPTYVLGKKVRFDIWHFSGYMVSTDRHGSKGSTERVY